jgi:hypothetical protein
LQLHQQSRAEEFPAVCQVVERLHVEGDHYVREAATIGFLEAIQNIWSSQDVDPKLFARYLLPVSAQWWQNLNDFWDGNSKFVGERL